MVAVTEKYVDMPTNKHHGRRSRTQMLAVHSAECPLKRGYARSLTSWLNESIASGGPAASINAFADPGVLVRSVNTFNAAWHASWANTISVGYETAAYAAYSRAQWMTLEGRRMLERLAIEMAADAKIFDIPLRWLTGEQVNAIRAGNTKIKGLAAHRQIDPAHRSDPGDGFPYAYLLKRIKHHSGVEVSHQSNAPAPIEKEKDMATPEQNWDEPMGLGKDKAQARSYLLWTHRDTNRTLDNTEEIVQILNTMSAQNEKLLETIVNLSAGGDFDKEQLLQDIEDATARGFQRSIESISQTTTAELK